MRISLHIRIDLLLTNDILLSSFDCTYVFGLAYFSFPSSSSSLTISLSFSSLSLRFFFPPLAFVFLCQPALAHSFLCVRSLSPLLLLLLLLLPFALFLSSFSWKKGSEGAREGEL